MERENYNKPPKRNGVGLAARITSIVFIILDAIVAFVFLILTIVFVAVNDIPVVLAALYGALFGIEILAMIFAIGGLNTSKTRIFSKGIGVANCIFNTPVGVLILVARAIENNDY